MPLKSSQRSAASTDWQLVHVYPDAPPKPSEGAPCNGCGLCCLLEPCPLGVLVSRRWRSACAAVRWSAAEQRYLCGMLSDFGGVTGLAQPWVVRALTAVARRSIAAGIGCDASFQIQPEK